MELFEFLKFSQEDKYSAIILVMKIIVSSLLSIFFYKYLGGKIFIPNEVTMAVFLNFVFSYEILIPILSVTILTSFSYFIIPNILKFLTYLITLLSYFIAKYILDKIGGSTFLVNFVTFFSKHIFKVITMSLPPVIYFEEFMNSEELKKIISENLKKEYGILILFIQLKLIYSLILHNNYVFTNSVGSICQITLSLSIATIYFSIYRSTFLFHYSKQFNTFFKSIYNNLL